MSLNGIPIFPHAKHFFFELVKTFSMNFVVVDFPLVPVTPIRKYLISKIFKNSKSVVIFTLFFLAFITISCGFFNL